VKGILKTRILSSGNLKDQFTVIWKKKHGAPNQIHLRKAPQKSGHIKNFRTCASLHQKNSKNRESHYRKYDVKAPSFDSRYEERFSFTLLGRWHSR
jgi:hypothetical protein